MSGRRTRNPVRFVWNHTSFAWRWARENRSRIAAYTGLFAVLTFGAFGADLTSNGYFIYRDWSWPFGGNSASQIVGVFSPALWTNAGADPAGYTRSITSFPLGLAVLSGVSLSRLETPFVVFTFAVSFLLALVTAELLAQWLGVYGPSWKKELLRISFLACFFFNPVSVNWNADIYYPFVWGECLLLIAIFSLLLDAKKPSVHWAIVGGTCIGISGTLLPELYVYDVVFCGLIAICLVLFGKRLGSLKTFVVSLAVSTPGLAITYFAFWYAGAASGAPLRPATLDSIAFLSSNSHPLSVLDLGGYWWPLVTATPPWAIGSIGQIGSWSTLGSPPVAAYPPGNGVWLWILIETVYPVITFASLLFRSIRLRMLPFAVLALASALLAMGSQGPIPGLVQLEVALGALPYAGSVLQTTAAVPSNFLTVTAAAYSIMMAAAIQRAGVVASRVDVRKLVSRDGTHLVVTLARKERRNLSGRTILVSACLIGIVIIGSWQFASGSFVPAGETPGISPNNIPSVGATAPEAVPKADLAIYATISTNVSTGAVYWPGPALSTSTYWPGNAGGYYDWTQRSSPSLAVDSPAEFVRPAGFDYLIANNLTADVAPELSLYGIDYLVIDNMSPEALDSNFGTTSLHQILSFLNSSSSLRLVSSFAPDSWLYQNELPSSVVTFPAATIGYGLPLSEIGLASTALSQINLRPAFVNTGSGLSSYTLLQGIPEGIELDSGHALTILTPENLISETPHLNSIVGFNGSLTASLSQTVPGGVTNQLDPPYQNWTISTWSGSAGGPVNISVVNGSRIELTHEGSLGYESVNYLTALVSNESDGIRVNPGGTVDVSGSVEMQLTKGDSGTGQVAFVGVNSDLQTTILIPTQPVALNKTWSKIALNETLPAGTAYFTFRSYADVNGTVSMKNISFTWTQLSRESNAFSGNSISFVNESLALPWPTSFANFTVYANLVGSGTISGKSSPDSDALSFDSENLEWITVPAAISSSASELNLTGTFNLSGLVVVPDSFIQEAGQPPTYTVQLESDFQYLASEKGVNPAFLSLQQQPSPEWRASIDQGSGQSSVGLTITNATLFVVPAGAHHVVVGLSMIQSLPILLIAVGLWFLVACPAIAIHMRSRHCASTSATEDDGR